MRCSKGRTWLDLEGQRTPKIMCITLCVFFKEVHSCHLEILGVSHLTQGKKHWANAYEEHE